MGASLATRRIEGSDFRTSAAALELLLHIDAVLLRSCLRLLVRLLIRFIGLSTNGNFGDAGHFW